MYRVFLLALLTASPLAAHDMWIEPATFRPGLGSPFALELRLGDEVATAERFARDPRRIVRFVAVDAEGARDVPGIAGQTPAGVARIERPGLLVIAYESLPSRVELEGEKFEAYLAEEGLERVIALRRERGESAAPGTERFSRSLKALVAAGELEPEETDRPLGLPLELVAERNPYGQTAGATLGFRLLFRGQAVAGALVEAVRLERPEEVLAARTDAEGRVAFSFDGAGAWRLTAVHMIAAPDDAGVDWESFWAALTFALPEAN